MEFQHFYDDSAIDTLRALFSEKQYKAKIITFGCQQNFADSDKLRGILAHLGCVISDSDDSDLIVVNTCAVRDHAEQRALGNIGALVHAKRRNPNQIITLAGCMVSQKDMPQKIKNSYRHVDILLNTASVHKFPNMLLNAISKKTKVFSEQDEPFKIIENLPLKRDMLYRAWLPVMYGCNNFCSYCVVPYVRGRERSRTPENIINEAKKLIAEEYKDITLLGQNVNSYNSDLTDFPKLLKTLANLPGEFLIRFMTSHPKDATQALFDAIAQSPKAAKHIHLPFQAGSDRILSLMNRGYSADHYLNLIDSARKTIPNLVVTSDVIVGFPGETEDEFNMTLDLVRHANFDALFTFIYSKRNNTPAALLEDPVTREEKQQRFDTLLNTQNEISANKHKAYIGKTLSVLVDGSDPNDKEYPLRARTNGGRLVHLKGPKSLEGHFVSAKITNGTTWSLIAELD